MEKHISFERYRLILRHEFLDGKGGRHDIEEPRVVECAIMHGMNPYPVPLLINNMMEKMKAALLKEEET